MCVSCNSCDQPLSISLWNDLTEARYFDGLKNWADSFQVIGFRALKPYTRRGFSMNSSMSTRIIYEPKGERARVLQDWVKLFHQKIVDRQAMLLDVRYPCENKNIVSIADLKRRNPSNTMQEEILWIEVTIQNADLEKVNAYTGCSNCSKRSNLPLQKRFSCSSCSNKESIFTERATFKFEARDNTGSMAFTTFNNDTERLFRKTAAEIYAIKEEGDYDSFKTIQNMLSSIPFYIQVGPTLHLAQNNVLEWALKSVELKDDPNTQEVTDQTQGTNETQVPKIMTEMQSSEPFIPTPNLKISSMNHLQQETFTEEPESPQQTFEMNKQTKSAGKRPMETKAEQDTSQLLRSQPAAKKKLCFGGMSPQKRTKTQGHTKSLGRGNV
ncbi:replication protein A 70 kDa DNA-binding subunit B-like isoform X1 [Chenopodium quinoa]|uniref:replication protein A 70 kDa DNA-binding subunit B-like isoform X1 n=1 Tax=Chenopodium quinoa TaxID=63459 RepID=UPI000B793F86|nr:replication protein A 70 kDa DNA-binding subunit B-like isoform X1 [Chenopodium quinoa]